MKFLAATKGFTFNGSEKHYVAIKQVQAKHNCNRATAIRILLDEAIAQRELQGEIFWTSRDIREHAWKDKQSA
jgi:hypothetical protein